MVAVKQKKRDRVNRSRTKLILMGTEGNNKTEKLYFTDLFRNNKSYRVRFTNSTDTDPIRIVEATARQIVKDDIDLKDGDLAFCAIDTDTNTEKQAQIDKAIELAKRQQIKVILSNPCFEIWFLQHFRYSTKAYTTSAEVIKELQTYMPNYKKNASIYVNIKKWQVDAVKRAKKLEKYHRELGRKRQDMMCNPSTEVYKVLEVI